MSFINSWASLVDSMGFKDSNNPTMKFLGGGGVLRGAASVGNPFTTFSSHNALTSLATGKGNLFGNYEEQTGAEETFNRISATMGMLAGGYFAAGGTIGGAAGAGGGAEAGAGAGAGMGGLALGEGGSTAAGSMGGMTLAEGGYAGAGGLGAGASAGAEAGAVGGTSETAEGFSMPSWATWKNASRALRMINSINRLRNSR